MAVEKGNTVKVQYEGKLESGEVFDKSQEGQELEFKTGGGNIIPGFEEAVIGMEKGEEKEIEISPEDAYGSRREELIKTVPTSQLPDDAEPKEGMMLEAKSQAGKAMPGKITEVDNDNIKVDFNHPLADKKLIFNIKVVDVS